MRVVFLVTVLPSFPDLRHLMIANTFDSESIGVSVRIWYQSQSCCLPRIEIVFNFSVLCQRMQKRHRSCGIAFWGRSGQKNERAIPSTTTQPFYVLYGKAKTAEMLSLWGKESFKEGVGSFRMQFSAGAAIVHFIQ